ncbi:unnamed protein product, partial [Nesidiocoris tenuis]
MKNDSRHIYSSLWSRDGRFPYWNQSGSARRVRGNHVCRKGAPARPRRDRWRDYVARRKLRRYRTTFSPAEEQKS